MPWKKKTDVKGIPNSENVPDVSVGEQAINESEEKFRLAIERISDAFVALDTNWCYTYVNAKAEKIFNKAPGYLIGKHIWTEFPEGVGQPFQRLHEEAMATQQYQFLEEHYPPYDRWFENHIYPSPTGLTIYFKDITERKKIELANKQSEEAKNLIINSALDGIVCINIEGIITVWNPKATKIFDWEEVEMLGKHLLDIIIAEPYRNKYKEGLKNYLKSGSDPLFNKVKEIIALNRDQQEIPIELSMTPIKQNDGEFFCFFIRDISKHKKTQQKLSESENRLRTIIQTEPECIKLLGPNCELLEMNPAGLAMIETESNEQVLGHSVLNLVVPEYKESFSKLISNVFKGESGTLEFEMQTLKGNKLWIETHEVPLRNAEGEIISALGVSRDITERKKAEYQILNEKELANSVINSLPGIFYLYDSSGKFLRWNKNLETVSGYSAKEITNMHPIDFFHEDDKQLLTERIEEVFEKGFADVEANFYSKDKKKIPFYFNGWKIEYENKTCLIGVGIDITKRKKAEGKLLNSENKLRAFFRSTPDSNVLLGKNFEILAFNSSANELNQCTYGTEFHEGDIFTDSISTEARADIVELLQKALEGVTNQGEFLIPNIKSGRSEWWQTAYMPAYDKDGHVLGVVANSTNINEIKQAEIKLKTQFKELRKTNQELDRFVYSVSHDLRAPLSSILGLVNVAEMETPSPAFKNYLAMIRSNILRLDGFIKDILDYSRNSRMEVKSEKIILSELIAEIQNNFKLIEGAARLKINVEVNDNVNFCSDRGRVEILLNNLFSNAIKYQDTQKDSSFVLIQILVSAEKAYIKFSDNGIGIEKAHLKQIFDMFYRASEGSQGSGLGLYIAKETINKLNGTIKVQSVIRKSTTFEITIPNSSDSISHK